MGCCGTKDDSYRQKNQFAGNPDYMCAYVKKTQIKEMLERVNNKVED